MLLFSFSRANDAIEPWLSGNLWVVDCRASWCIWLIGVASYGDVLTFHFGPIELSYWREKS